MTFHFFLLLSQSLGMNMPLFIHFFFLSRIWIVFRCWLLGLFTCKSLGMYFHFSGILYLELALLGNIVIAHLTLYCHVFHQSDCVSISSVWEFHRCTFCQHFYIIGLLNFTYSGRSVVVPHCDFHFHFPGD